MSYIHKSPLILGQSRYIALLGEGRLNYLLLQIHCSRHFTATALQGLDRSPPPTTTPHRPHPWNQGCSHPPSTMQSALDTQATGRADKYL